MGVPGGVGIRCPGDTSDAGTGFDEPAGEEHALTVDVSAIRIAYRRGFLIELKRFSGCRRGEQVKGLGLKRVHVLENFIGLARFLLFQKTDQVSSRLKAVEA